LEDKFGVIIEQTDVAEVKTLAEFIAVVQGKAESKAAAG
jgi:acyl carrier protein